MFSSNGNKRKRFFTINFFSKFELGPRYSSYILFLSASNKKYPPLINEFVSPCVGWTKLDENGGNHVHYQYKLWRKIMPGNSTESRTIKRNS